MKHEMTKFKRSAAAYSPFSITIPDRILRVLNIIDTFFKAQHLPYDQTDPFPYLLDHKGQASIHGRYIASVSILSDVELFSLQLYKKELTVRFENTSNLTLLKNQLLSIRDRAKQIRDYYNSFLTKGNKILDDFLSKSKALSSLEHFQERLVFLEFHRSVPTISNYHIMEIYLGVDLHGEHGFAGNSNKYTYT
jgi:methyl-accepting chemotaxis protein